MIRTGLSHLRNGVIVRNGIIRHSSTLPNTIISYIKDKGIYIPMADRILSPKEYSKYELYRNIKLGDVNWLNEYTSKNPLGKEEKVSLTEYITDLKKQPYSIPNFAIGYAMAKFSFVSFTYATSLSMAGFTDLVSNVSVLRSFFGVGGTLFNVGITLSIIPSTIVCYSILKHGAKIFVNEFKSPYYDYDEMTRLCNK